MVDRVTYIDFPALCTSINEGAHIGLLKNISRPSLDSRKTPQGPLQIGDILLYRIRTGRRSCILRKVSQCHGTYDARGLHGDMSTCPRGSAGKLHSSTRMILEQFCYPEATMFRFSTSKCYTGRTLMPEISILFPPLTYPTIACVVQQSGDEQKRFKIVDVLPLAQRQGICVRHTL